MSNRQRWTTGSAGSKRGAWPWLSLLGIVFVAGCGTTVSTAPRPDAYYELADSEQPAASLFSGDAAVLSDDAIRKILDYEYVPPRLARVALMPFGRELWSTWSEELALANESMQNDVLETLRASPRIYDASYLPSILVPENRTVPHLREAAARYQADLLIVYRSFCRSFDKYRIFRADESRAYCGVEAVLLDTRTGLVPFTTVANHSYDVVENESDTNFEETRMRAQLDATTAAMADVSGAIVGFLAGPN